MGNLGFLGLLCQDYGEFQPYAQSKGLADGIHPFPGFLSCWHGGRGFTRMVRGEYQHVEKRRG